MSDAFSGGKRKSSHAGRKTGDDEESELTLAEISKTVPPVFSAEELAVLRLQGLGKGQQRGIDRIEKPYAFFLERIACHRQAWIDQYVGSAAAVSASPVEEE